MKRYEALKKELQSLYDAKGDAAKFRFKCRWLEESERSTKSFFYLEKEIKTEKLFPNWKTKMVKLFRTKNKFS